MDVTRGTLQRPEVRIPERVQDAGERDFRLAAREPHARRTVRGRGRRGAQMDLTGREREDVMFPEVEPHGIPCSTPIATLQRSAERRS